MRERAIEKEREKEGEKERVKERERVTQEINYETVTRYVYSNRTPAYVGKLRLFVTNIFFPIRRRATSKQDQIRNSSTGKCSVASK